MQKFVVPNGLNRREKLHWIQNQFRNMKKKSDQSMADYLSNITELLGIFSSLNYRYDTYNIINMVIQGLGEEYTGFKYSIQTTKFTSLSQMYVLLMEAEKSLPPGASPTAGRPTAPPSLPAPTAGPSDPGPSAPSASSGVRASRSAASCFRIRQNQPILPPAISSASASVTISVDKPLPTMSFSFAQPQQQSLFQTPNQQQQQKSLFQTPTQPQAFSFPQTPATPNLFQQSQQQQPQNPQFQQPQPQFQQQQPQNSQFQQIQQQPQQQFLLLTVDKKPASYNTKFTDLHPDSQKYLLQIEERILEYRVESQSLDHCSRLHDSSVSNSGFEQDAAHIIQELGGISTAIDRERNLIQEQMSVMNTMMRDTEMAVRSFIIVHQRFFRATSSATTTSATALTSGLTQAPNPTSQQITTNPAPVFDFYSGVPKRPSTFLEHTFSRFEKYLAECSQWVEELEQLFRLDSEGAGSSSGTTLLQSLPTIISNVHDYFIHVTAKVEGVHQRIASMKTAYLAELRRHCGDWNNPFLEADRREIAKQEAAARIVHPTLHLPAVPSQPSTQVAGLITNSAIPGSTSSFPQQSSGSSFVNTILALNNPSSSTFSSSTPSSSLFSVPSSSPAPPLVGLPQSTPFGSSQTTSLFGSITPTSSAPFGVGSSVGFSTPLFGSGQAVNNTGVNFGGTTKSSKPRSRTSRR